MGSVSLFKHQFDGILLHYNGIFWWPRGPIFFSNILQSRTTVKVLWSFKAVALCQFKSWQTCGPWCSKCLKMVERATDPSHPHPSKEKFPTESIIVEYPDQQWDSDLLDVVQFSRYNNGTKYILVVIEFFLDFSGPGHCERNLNVNLCLCMITNSLKLYSE